ncbi:MAG: hypothetical protein OM95_03340 [Bdellovibrio sp. ArHS]|uniref:hypothetical protein n=1 Tax=Bdellovibrio sp. ArHS TaxID=1569284 RepID=UPI0005824B51|nr:hypothetical protein [Bdellovibrio sp. ArHS]KHD89415.1 MAG: hypothetical protein OM95_03340 [Bdellovibrio sp. ArHS]
MKLKAIAGALLSVTTSLTSLSAHAASMVLAVEKVSCGATVSIEKTEETLLVLRLDIAKNNVCGKQMILEIESQDIKGVVQNTAGSLELNPHMIGDVLPIKIGDETILMRLSSSAQAQIRTANTRSDLQASAKRQDEIQKREKAKDVATGAAAAGALVVGGAAVAAAAAEQSER